MFRASTCPSSGRQIVLSQHLASSLSVNGCTVARMRADCSARSKKLQNYVRSVSVRDKWKHGDGTELPIWVCQLKRIKQVERKRPEHKTLLNSCKRTKYISNIRERYSSRNIGPCLTSQHVLKYINTMQRKNVIAHQHQGGLLIPYTFISVWKKWPLRWNRRSSHCCCSLLFVTLYKLLPKVIAVYCQR